MVIAPDVLVTLEFDKVREILAQHCQFSVAAEYARSLVPATDVDQVKLALALTREAVSLLREQPRLSIGGFRDIRPVLMRARQGQLLDPPALRDVFDTVEAGRVLRGQLLRHDEWRTRFPQLSAMIARIPELPQLAASLERSIGPRGEILDTASAKLAEIRREASAAHERLLERLRRLLNDPHVQPALQEPIITQRDGRYVIPVRADRRQAVPGITHDVSASGQTLFVEPFSVIDLTNRWRELLAAEEHEIQRILRQLTEAVLAAEPALQTLIEVAAQCDLTFAKARLAAHWRATEPEIVEAAASTSPAGHPTHRLNLKQARHPLLPPETVVPIDLALGEQYRILVITGPNTGGKTVALKTAGLLALMAQSGLFIPAAPGSQLSVFTKMFADIGDEQSIEQNLSTFSAHMRRMRDVLAQADQSSLVLIDELAAGTDPQEGAALARALLRALLDRWVLGIVTTHYPEVKAFAAVTPGLENASVEFDLQTLSPTYRLILGIPGQSNALVIAERLGLPRDVLEEARRYVAPDAAQLEALLAEMRRRLAAAEKTLQEAQRIRDDAERMQRQAEERLHEAEQRYAEAWNAAYADLEAELTQARELVKTLRRQLSQADRFAATMPTSALSDEATKVEQQLRQIQRRVRTRPRSHPQVMTSPGLRVGDVVDIPSLGLRGEVVALLEEDQVEVQVGSFRVRQPRSAVRPAADGTPARQPSSSTRVKVPPPPSVPLELHLRGMRVAEALPALERYLDDAIRAGLPWVRIVHGKGTGTIREVVHQVLREHPAVDHFELAQPHEGGAGVTIVYLKG